MANSNISVRVNGRPASNGGHIPLVSINSPQFLLEDKEYVGFNDNSYFFTVKIVENYVIYKLVKNNVRSHNAIRPSTFHIAFSIPKGFQLANENTPYDVLKTLLDVFLNKCLECKDTVRGTYEFKDGLVDQHVLDEAASSFSIIPCETPWRVMNTKGSIGYYIGDDQTIKQILADIQYPEFQKFSEIVLANSSNGSTYAPIDNLEIPRKIAYSLYIDNQLEGVVTDEAVPISINSHEDPICYTNKTLTFTIEEALAGKVSEHVYINKAAETIRVSTQRLAAERETTTQIVVIPNNYQQNFIGKNLFMLIGQNGMINIDKNLRFTLRGIENSQDFKNRLKLELKTNEYVLKGYTLQGNEMRATIEPQLKPKEQTSTKPKSKAGLHKYPATVPSSEDKNKLPVVDLAIKLSNCAQIPERAKVSLREMNKRNIIAFTTAHFNPTNKTREKEAHFYIDKKLINKESYILFKLNNTTYYKANIGNDDCRNGIEDFILLKDDDFEKITFFKLYKKRIILAAILFSAFILLTFGPTLGIYHHSDIPNPVPTPDPSYTAPPIGATDDQIKHTLDSINSKLNTKELSFDDVIKIYNLFAQDSANFNRVDKEKLEGKTIGRIKDYYSVVIAITNGDVTTIESYLNRGNELHIYNKHRNCLYLICKAYFPNGNLQDYSSTQKEEAEVYFRNHSSLFKSFGDLKKIEDAISPQQVQSSPTKPTSGSESPKQRGGKEQPTKNNNNKGKNSKIDPYIPR